MAGEMIRLIGNKPHFSDTDPSAQLRALRDITGQPVRSVLDLAVRRGHLVPRSGRSYL
jgi:hypothetical protein